MNSNFITEDLEAMLESLEQDESDEMDEWAEGSRKKPGGKSKTASGKNLNPPKPSSAYVTESRLEAALARVGAQIKTNSDAIAGVNSKVNTLGTDIAHQTKAIRKEADERKKDVNGLKSNVQMAALLPLLIKPTTRAVKTNVEGTELQANDKVLIDKGDSLSSLLPILMLGGMGSSSDGSSGSSSSSNGGFGDPMMMMVLALAITQK